MSVDDQVGAPDEDSGRWCRLTQTCQGQTGTTTEVVIELSVRRCLRTSLANHRAWRALASHYYELASA